jgi:hypothetical protein
MRDDTVGLKKRKVRRLVVEEDRCGDWRIRLYFDKGRCMLLRQIYDNHRSACLAASGIPPVEHNWVPPIKVTRTVY